LYSNGSITTATGTFTANLFVGNGASITNLDYSKITANKPNVTATTQAASGGGAFSYSTTSGFSFTPAAIPTYATQTLSASGSGGLSLDGSTFKYTPPDLSGYLTSGALPYATTSAWGVVKVSTGLAVSSGIITNNGVVGLSAGTGVGVSGTAGGTYTVSIGQSVGTGDSVRFGSLGIGTTATGTSGEIVATNNITAYYSDDRLKTKLGEIENALDKIDELSGFYYEENELAESLGYEKHRQVGVSAQSTQRVMPEIVAPAPIDNQYLTVRYEKFAPLLIQGIKELRKELKALRNDINQLKDKE
jgi:hypothetical protein